MKNRILLLVAAAAVLGLGACTSDAEVLERLRPVEARHPIRIEPQMRELHVAPDAARQGLRDDDRAKIREFVTEFANNGHGKLSVAAPEGSANARLAVKAVAEAVAVAENQGLPRNEIDVGSYVASRGDPNAPVVLSFIAYAVALPDCGNFSEDIGFSPDNQPTPNFGCATQHNLAVMVDDPRDLIAPRTMTPADAARRATVLKAYREGQKTATERDDQDSGAVSEVNN